MNRFSLKKEHIEKLEQAHIHYPKRSGLEMFETLSRIWQQECSILGRAPSISHNTLGRALKLDTSIIEQVGGRARHYIEIQRRVIMPRPTYGGGRKMRWVVQLPCGRNQIIIR